MEYHILTWFHRASRRTLVRSENLLVLLSVQQQHHLLKAILLDDTVHPAVVEAMHPVLSEMPSTHAAAVMKELHAETKCLHPLEDKRKNLVGINDHPQAVASFLEDVEKIVRMPVPWNAKTAMKLLIAIAQRSVPDWESGLARRGECGSIRPWASCMLCSRRSGARRRAKGSESTALSRTCRCSQRT